MPALKILDSWALLAWLLDEAPASNVESMFEAARDGEISLIMSWINAGEVYYMLVRKRSFKVAEGFLARLPFLPIELIVPDEDAIKSAARLKSTRKISYADGFAAALALGRIGNSCDRRPGAKGDEQYHCDRVDRCER